MISKIRNIVTNIISKKASRDYLWIFCGQTLASFIHLLSMSMVLSYLGHEGNGILLGVQALCYLCGDIANPYCFQSVIRFISNAKDKDDKDNVIAQGFALDLIAGTAGLLISVALIRPICSWIGYSEELISYVWIYSPCVFFRHVSTGTAMGILRNLGKFSWSIIIYDAQSALRVILYIGLIAFNGGIFALLTIEMILEVFYALAIILAACLAARREQLQYPPRCFPRFKWDFLKFNILYMASTTVDLILGNVSSLIITKYLGTSPLSVYKVLERIGSLIQKFTTPVSQVVYPEFCKAVSQKKYSSVKRFAIKYFKIVGSAGVLIIILTTLLFPLWRSFFSLEPNYVWDTALYMSFSVITCVAVPIHSRNTALGLMHYNLINVVIINSLYCVALVPIITQYGLKGLFVLLALQALVMAVVKWIQGNNYIRRIGENNE